MDIKQVEDLVRNGESSSLEFKTTTGQLKAVFETVCAFLNGKGGIILIGVKDNGQIIGQDTTDNTRRELSREVKKIEPPAQAQIDINFISIKDKKFIIALNVQSGTHAPYIYDGRPYSRVQSSTGVMPQHLYEQLIVRRGQLNHSWEEQPAKGYDINLLDHEEIRRTVKEGIDHNRISIEVLSYDVEHILRNLKLFRNGILTNAAIVLYAKKVEPNYANCMIRMARFRGIDNLGDFIDNQRVYGNAFHLIHAAIEFTQRHLPIASYFDSNKLQRIDQPAIHPLALREALVNSVSHRDYSTRGVTIALAIYDDRLEIWNNGELPSELKIEDLRLPHQSYPRNEEISMIFYKRGWVEGWGTGTLRMIAYCNQNGTPEPEFQEYSGGFAVIFKFKELMGRDQNTLQHIIISHLSSRQNEILQILSHGERMAVSDIAKQLKDKPAPRTLRDDLARLKKEGFIDLTGRAKSSKWFLLKK